MTDNRYAYRGSVIEAIDGAGALLALGEVTLTHGERRTPRGLSTTEIVDVTTIIHDPGDVCLAGMNRRRYLPAIGALEGLLMLGGISDPNLLAGIAPVFRRFQDGGALHGAYGPRLGNQLPKVIEKLRRDPHTRQGVATIWDPAYDLTPMHSTPRDVPCTVYLAFREHGGTLEMKTHMRSNDLWRGFCYDIIQFTLLQAQVARCLGLPAGAYTHHVDSMHVYDEDREAVLGLTVQGVRTDVFYTGHLDVEAGTSWANVRSRAQSLLYDEKYVPGNETERWLQETIRKKTEE